MRITAGLYKGRRLQTPDNQNIRPTSDRIRQAIFNALESRGLLSEAVVIDGFCGTGALGLEALSRGAKYCLFMDKNTSLCQKNIRSINIADNQYDILKTDSTKPKSLTLPQKADLVFLDPPYGQEMIEATLEALFNAGAIDENSMIIAEMGHAEISPNALMIEAEKKYGNTKVIFGRISKNQGLQS